MPTNITIVLADSDVRRRQNAAERIGRRAEIRECDNTSILLRTVVEVAPPVVVIGCLGNEPSEAIEAAHLVRDINPSTKVIVIADYSSETLAIRALRAGVSEYLRAPVDPLEIDEAVSRSLPETELCTELDGLVGGSEAIRQVRDLIHRIAPLNSTVLITGESGTGKEIVARLIHQRSLRARGPFVCVNCAAIPDNLVESELFGHERGAFTGAVTRQTGQMKLADHGTLFLDEIGDMSLLAQAKVLRALEQREVQPLGASRAVAIDLRLIAATNRDIEKMVAEDRFRSDLYYRLDVSRIHLPPLRERTADIPLLAVHFLRELNRAYGRQLQGFMPAALQTLARHDWPGNVRQLRNVIENAVVVCNSDLISDQDLRVLRSSNSESPPPIRKAAPVIPTKKLRPNKESLLEALRTTHGNVTKAAEILKWSRSTMYREIAKHRIERSEDALIETA